MDTILLQEQIVACESRLLEAIRTSDIEVLDAMLHDQLLFIAPNGLTVTKAMDMDAHRSGTMVIEEITPTIELIHPIEDTAVVTLVYRTKGKMLGDAIQGTFRYIRVWRLFGDAWKVIGGSCCKIGD